MKIKTGLFGVLLSIATATAYGLGVQSAPAEPAVSTPAANPVINLTPAQISERARAYIAQIGVDPDSDNGQILIAWFTRIVQEPGYLARLTTLRSSSPGLVDTMLPPAARLKALRVTADMARGSRNNCAMPDIGGKDLAALAKTLPSKSLKGVLEMMDILLNRDGTASGDEHYTVAELLDVDARVNTIELPASLSKPGASKSCEAIAFAVGMIDKLPEPEQQRITYELFKMISGGKSASETVLADPDAYLDEVFDERRLQEAIRSQLPPDGSRPLPYSRLIVDGEWVNKTTPKAAGPYVDTYVNRRNNGVVAELMTTRDGSGATDWSYFGLTSGIAELMGQSVQGRFDAQRLGMLKDASAIAVANAPLAEGKRIEFALPQPSSRGQLTRRCEIGKTEPASTIFGTLTGNAVNLDCSEVRKDGTTSRVRSAWLADYGIELSKTIDDEAGRTDVIIKNVTIVKP
ncbi:hypothetical protein VXE32_001073 [Burkholderia cepacia]|nr:hypothetical protein [Burkholderia cepacia]